MLRTGPFTMPPSQLGAFAKSDEGQTSANIEWHVQPLSLDKFGSPLHAFDAITPSVCNLQPTSRGHVRIKSADPAGASGHHVELPRDRGGPASRGRGPQVHAPHHGGERARALRARGVAAGACARERCGSASARPATSARRSSIPVGTCRMGVGRARRRRRPAAGPRRRGLTRHRRFGHAAHHVGQHQCADRDDRGARRGLHPAPRELKRCMTAEL